MTSNCLGLRTSCIAALSTYSATPQPKKAPQGLALAWWLEQLGSAATRRALIERSGGPLDEAP